MSVQTTRNGQNVTCWDWDDGNICWNDNPYCWDDVCLAEEVLEEAGGGITGDGKVTDWMQGYEKLDEPKKRRFITLVGKVKGEKDIFKDKKEVKDVNISIKDIKLTVSEVLGIKIDVEKD